MFEAATQRNKLFWRFIYDYQPLSAGLLALLAAAITAGFLGYQSHVIAEEGKHERDFRMKQHEIEMQTKRRAAAVMLAADIRSVAEMAHLESLAEDAKEQARKFKDLGDGMPAEFPFFSPMDKSFFNNYSNYTENMPLMRIKTVQEVSRFYIVAAILSEAIESSNAKMEEKAMNKTRASFLTYVSGTAKITKKQFEKTLPLLIQEADDAKTELDHLKGEAINAL